MTSKTPQFDKALDQYFALLKLDENGGQEGECSVSKEKFTIAPEDVEFYKKMRVPLPTISPSERIRKILAFENSYNLFNAKSAFSGKPIISLYLPSTEYKIYEHKEWFSDKWEALEYGRDYEEGKSFFEQFGKLQKVVPRPNLFSDASNVNSDYVNESARLRNCYLVFYTFDSENLAFTDGGFKSRNCVNCFTITNCENCYAGKEIANCYNCYVIEYSRNCHDSSFLFDCRNCSNCFMSANLRNKQYVFAGKQLSKEAYEEKIKKVNLENIYELEKYKKQFEEVKQNAIRKPMWVEKSENCKGYSITSSKDCSLVCWAENAKNVKYSFGAINVKDAQDLVGGGEGDGAELMYGCGFMFGRNYQIKFSTFVRDSRNLEYSDLCRNCSDCFGCVGLRNKQFCIFNKQYTEEGYWKKLDEIKTAMLKNGEYGQFFPQKLSPHPYSLSLNMSYPGFDNLEEAKKLGYRIEDVPSQIQDDSAKVLKSTELPENIEDVNDEILNTVVEAESGKKFKFVPLELNFYREHHIALPREAPLERLAKWRKDLNIKVEILKRNCPKCGKEFQTLYKENEYKDRVYCNACYLKAIA